MLAITHHWIMQRCQYLVLRDKLLEWTNIDLAKRSDGFLNPELVSDAKASIN
jgi:hypothetical protein